MIRAVLIFNTHGKPRLSKFFVPLPPLIQQSLIAQIFSLISDRPAGVCNFLDAPDLVFPSLNPDGTVRSADPGSGSGNVNPSGSGGGAGSNYGGGAGGAKGKGRAGDGVEMREDDTRVIYRHYATLYFVFVVDGAESELGILDLIQVFVESLDRAFENVCELDLIFHYDEASGSFLTAVHHVLAEIIQGGLVLETNINEISACVQASSRNRKASAASANPLIPSAFAGGPSGRNLSRGGGSADGPRRWLAAMGV